MLMAENSWGREDYSSVDEGVEGGDDLSIDMEMSIHILDEKREEPIGFQNRRIQFSDRNVESGQNPKKFYGAEKSEGRSPKKFYENENQRDEVPRSSMELKNRREVLWNWKIRGTNFPEVLRLEGRSPHEFYRIENHRDEVPRSSTELKIIGTKSP
ncbi:hypothetical protein LWI29_008776 [Acer saccharum]|uniref:Uncharacterized protein n=1 Tax=Acer saccharum TaxID=4024 RepID=A0AA39W0Q2_ACESA|nr:hypothetical protein LWI29_008776 [Acer saccharum]